MKHSSRRWRRRRGIFTFEWILLVALFGIGLIGAVAALRGVLVSEYCGLVQCIEQVDLHCCAQCGDDFCRVGQENPCPATEP